MLLPERRLHALFHAAREAFPERPALRARGEELSYAALAGRASAIASVLAAAAGGGAPGRCALLGGKACGTYAGLLGILEAGACYVPLNPRFPPARSLAMLAAAEVRALVVAEDAQDLARGLLAGVPAGLDVVLAGAAALPAWCADLPRHRFHAEPPPGPPGPDVPAGEDAYLLFTSGSTGAPKGIAISHASAVAYVEGVRARYAPAETDRFSQVFDLTFDLSVHDMFVCWAAGACLYPLPATGGLGIGTFIRKNAISFWFSVPSTAAAMAGRGELAPGALPSLRWSLFCGEALPARLAAAWALAAPGSVVENLYGPTEATIAFTAFRVPSGFREEGIVPIGHPLPGQRVAVVDEAGVALPPGRVGELCLGGSQVAAGYWRRPDLTAERFRAPLFPPGEEGAGDAGTRWYRTGDLAVMTPGEGLVFRGRADRQVKIRGYRVEMQEVEDALRAAGGLDLAAVLPWPPGDAAAAVVGFVPRGVPLERILLGCRARLPDYMVPSRLVEVADWPLNANGKTDYGALRALMVETVDA
ncbi:amino acid adenylation domain-containing protein [Roseomonas nepalensis]|uniref:Amino acid adenylation domain-containing protein n=1 Tax=Muricoccus nepalensis TaxID=1854500 RepID=A0A502G4X8_9PROT|nr:amino acid adenylation domain-containing protein [Roseomonas nepalensis]TPG56854.1 amino acid adenylation domain-containing protein [Roseomonas nepalensis]